MPRFLITAKVPTSSYDIYQAEVDAPDLASARKLGLEMIRNDSCQEGITLIGQDDTVGSDWDRLEHVCTEAAPVD